MQSCIRMLFKVKLPQITAANFHNSGISPFLFSLPSMIFHSRCSYSVDMVHAADLRLLSISLSSSISWRNLSRKIRSFRLFI